VKRAVSLSGIMIKLDLDEKDDKKFIDEIIELISSVIRYFNPFLITICKIDNWFDHKWLGFFHYANYKKNERLLNPPFAPYRRIMGCYYKYENGKIELLKVEKGKQSCSGCLFSVYDEENEFIINPKRMNIWYSGNTRNNKIGSLMIYFLTEYDSTKQSSKIFYISYKSKKKWKIFKAKGISDQELQLIKQGG
jgi:hypothetical protein